MKSLLYRINLIGVIRPFGPFAVRNGFKAACELSVRRRLIVIALAALIGFTTTACPENPDDGPNTQEPGTQQPGTQDPGTQDPGAQQPGQPGGSGPRIAYSSDGVTWTAVAKSPYSPGSGHFPGVAYGNGRFVAAYMNVGSNGTAYSTDGVNWTEVPGKLFPEDVIHDIAFGNGKFVAVGGNPLRTGGRSRIAYSTDGENWTEAEDTTFGADGFIFGVAWGGDRFIAVGVHGSGRNTNMAYSMDGVTWTAFTTHNRSGGSIYYGNGTWLLPDLFLYYSTDNGGTWNYEYPSKAPSSINGIAWGSGRFVAVGSGIAYSPDGVDWTPVPLSTLPIKPSFRAVAWGNDKFVACAFSDGRMAYSPDGENWTAVKDSPFEGYVMSNIHDITWGGGKFVAVGSVTAAADN